MFLTVTDSDKPARVGIAAQLHDLGFRIVATRGTAAAIARMGIPVERLNKIGEGSPHVVDWIERGDVDLVINTPTGTAARADGYEIRRAAVARGDPVHHDDLRRHGRRARDRRRAPRRAGGALAAGDPRHARHARRCARCAVARDGRTLAPLGRRRAEVVRQRRARRLPVVSVRRPRRARARARAVLHARRGRALGRRGGRAAVPAARVLASAAPRRRHARLHARGRRPGHRAAGRAARRATGCGCSAARRRLRAAARGPARRCSSAAASASRRWRSGRTSSVADALVLLGFRDAAHAEGAALLPGARGRDRRRLGGPPRPGDRAARARSSDARRPRRGLRLRAAADARGGARAVRRARRARPARAGVGHGLRVRRLLRLRRADHATATCGCASTGPVLDAAELRGASGGH